MKLTDLLQEMSVSDALKLFKLSTSDLGDEKKLKKRHRELSVKYHPDKPGGDEETMKKVNDAWATLKRSKAPTSFVGQSSSRADYEQRKADNLKLAMQVKDILLKSFKPEAFVKYFEKIYDRSFKYDIMNEIPQKGASGAGWSAGFQAEFYADDMDPLFHMDFSVSLSDIPRTKSLGGSDLTFNTYVTSYGIFGNRKIKMAQRDWKFTNNSKVMYVPEEAFPKKVLDKTLSTKKPKRAFKPRDMKTALKTQLKAPFYSNFSRIPVGKGEHTLTIYRYTFMRHGYWGINGIYKKHGRVDLGTSVSWPETEDTLIFLKDLQKKVSGISDGAKLIKTINKLTKDYQDTLRDK